MIIAGAEQESRSGALNGVIAALREHAVLIAICALYVLVSFAVAAGNGLAHLFTLSLYPRSGLSALTASGLVFALGYFVWLGAVEKEKRPLSRAIRALTGFFSSWRGPVRLALPIILVSMVGSTYTSIKSLIPLLHPFAFDVTFAEWDKLLHFGIQPWEITHALFGSIPATVAVNFVYHIWFLVSWGFLLWQILNLGRPRERMRFLISFAMLWALVGSLAAVLLSSAGPVYYAYVTGLESPFAALMERLYAMNAELEASGGSAKIWVLHVQEWLWSTYENGATEVGSGISAMPSMHVAMAVLVALSGRQIGRIVGGALILYAVLIQIGSVHLGWHYAIDGYVAAILAYLIWRLAGAIVARTMPADLPSTPGNRADATAA